MCECVQEGTVLHFGAQRGRSMDRLLLLHAPGDLHIGRILLGS
jgi:hypothetical protein